MTGKISVTIIATGLEKESLSGKIVDFPNFESPKIDQSKPEISASSIEDDVKDIFKTLGINKNMEEEKNTSSADDTNRIKALRTDVPSFLKALD